MCVPKKRQLRLVRWRHVAIVVVVVVMQRECGVVVVGTMYIVQCRSERCNHRLGLSSWAHVVAYFLMRARSPSLFLFVLAWTTTCFRSCNMP